jgi:hypothetical protein
MSKSNALTFNQRCCQAAEELAMLGYAAESEALWRSAFQPLVAGDAQSLDPLLSEALRALLAGPPAGSGAAWSHWLDQARSLAARCSEALPTPAARPYARAPLLASLALLASVVVRFAAGTWTQTAVASAEYAPHFRAARVLDGNPATKWLPPDRVMGYVDITLPRRTSVGRVSVVNGHHPARDDRATRKARVVVYDDDREVDSAELTFAGVAAEPERQTVKLGGKQATRVRVAVLEYHGLGAAIAEVEVD